MKQKRFYREIKSILFFVLEYGIKNISFKMTAAALNKKEQTTEFVSKVHKGFMSAQNLIVQNLILLGNEKKNNKERIKDLNRQQKAKDIVEELKKNIQRVEYQEHIMRKLADTIAWQMINHDLTAIRRLYKFSSQVEIYNSNLNHDLEVVRSMFENDNECFPLITDITSFIQVGDLLVKEKNKLGIIELKEGKVNEEISDMIEEHLQIQCEAKLFFELEQKDDKFQKQFSRYVKQQSTALNAISIINKGEGTDSLGNRIKIYDKVFFTKNFTDTIQSMLQQVNKSNYSINCIEDCLFVGVYNTSNIPMYKVFEVWKKAMGVDFPTVDIRSFFFSPFSHPLFLHPFSIDDKVKIVAGEKIILMTLDIHAWLEKFKEKNANVRLMSKKETARINTKTKYFKSFEYNGQAIEIEKDNIKQIIHDGAFERMFNQFQKPSSVVDFLLFPLDEEISTFNDEEHSS